MHQADRKVGNFEGVLEHQFGFVPDITKQLWENIDIAMRSMASDSTTALLLLNYLQPSLPSSGYATTFVERIIS